MHSSSRATAIIGRLGLSQRFALVSALLAAGSILVVGLTAWWHARNQLLGYFEEGMHQEAAIVAEHVGGVVNSITATMASLSGNSMLSNALVDSAGKETYIAPFLQGFRSVNGVPLEITFTDFEGNAIATSGPPPRPEDVAWLLDAMAEGTSRATIRTGPDGPVVLGAALLFYSRTPTPEGALLYRYNLTALKGTDRATLHWGQDFPHTHSEGGRMIVWHRVPATGVLAPLKLTVELAAGEQATMPSLRKVAVIFLTAGVLTMAVILLLSRAAARRLTRNLRELQHLASTVVAEGFTGRRVAVHGTDEVAHVATAVNYMLDRLAELYAELENESRQKLAAEHRKLAEKTLALERSNAELEAFAYVASHDLRQPLRVVASYLTLLEETLEGRLDDDGREYIGFAVDGARRMDRLIIDLLEYSRVGRNGDYAGTVPLATCVSGALANLEVAVAEASATVEAAPDLPTIRGNGGELTRLLQNLIGNALKYRRPDRPPHIQVGWHREPAGSVTLFVRDNGIGIAPAHTERIFGIFQRLHGRGQYEGTGIGLAICKKVAENHRGHIRVESQPGHGSTFLLTLPG